MSGYIKFKLTKEEFERIEADLLDGFCVSSLSDPGPSQPEHNLRVIHKRRNLELFRKRFENGIKDKPYQPAVYPE